VVRTPLGAASRLAPASALVLLFLALPLLLLFRFSLNEFVPGTFMVEALTLENYVTAATDPYYRGVLRTTVLMAAGVTRICLVVAFPIAQFLARTTVRYKSLLVLAVVMPLFVGNAVRAAGWMVAFGQHGVINRVLLDLGLVAAPAALMYTPGAVVVGIVAVNLPFVVLTLESVIEGINPSAEEAARSLGATPFGTWRLVTLPLAMPGVLAAAVLSFILAMNAYATPVLLGGPSFRMMAPVIADEILAKNNWPFGATLAFVLMLVTLALTVLMNLAVSRRHSDGRRPD
jgi:putative spermidine/putrescine transport system permease protein